MKRYIFPDPLTAHCVLTPDLGAPPIVGVADTHPANGAPCQSFDVPPSVPNKTGAALTLELRGYAPIVLHGILDTITVGGGGFECDVFRMQKAGGIRPFRLDGHFPRYLDDGTEMLINHSTGFRAFARFVAGEFSQLDAFCQSLQDNHFNMLRVFLIGDTKFYPDPAMWWRLVPAENARFYQLLEEFVGDYLPQYGLYPDLVCCTQTQTLIPDRVGQVRHVGGVFDAMWDKYGVVSFVNEHGIYDNSVDGAVLQMQKPPGATFLLSTGSLDSGNREPFLPLHDVIEEHFNDANEWQRKSKDVMDDGNSRDKAGYVSETTRTDKEDAGAGRTRALAHYEDNANVATSMTMAAHIHTTEGKDAVPFGFSLPFVEAHNRGIAKGGIAYRRGRYSRTDPTPPGLIRQYNMTVDGLGTHPIPVRM